MDWQEFKDMILARYKDWHERGQITNTSKVIPVAESVSSKQWVMPTQRVEYYIQNSRSVALAHCRCRTLGKNCSSPTETCFYLNDAADKKVEDGQARRVSLEEAREHLALANRAGLVPMTVFNPDQHVLALCHCCPCCCHDLQFLLQMGRDDLVAQADYVARQDPELCTDCGACVERCHFGARKMVDNILVYEPAQCYGCGLCVTTCPAGAIEMVRRDQPEQYMETAS